MKTIAELKAIYDNEGHISKDEAYEIATEADWFCSDSMDHFYCVIRQGEREFGFVVFCKLRNGNFEVLIANPKVAEVAEWVRNDSDRFHEQWCKARAEAIGHAVAQSLTDGYELQDTPEVSQGFVKSFSNWF